VRKNLFVLGFFYSEACFMSFSVTLFRVSGACRSNAAGLVFLVIACGNWATLYNFLKPCAFEYNLSPRKSKPTCSA